MVHANPYFKYPKDLKSKMPRLNTRVRNAKELDSDVLFLNKGIIGGRKLAQNNIPARFDAIRLQNRKSPAVLLNHSPNKLKNIIGNARRSAMKKPAMQNYEQLYDSSANFQSASGVGIDTNRAQSYNEDEFPQHFDTLNRGYAQNSKFTSSNTSILPNNF